MKSLYFAAIVLPPAVAAEIDAIKQEFSSRFGTKHGLHTPPHITLFPPFHAAEEELRPVNNMLLVAAQGSRAFEVELEGFGRFGKDVIFVKVRTSEELQALRNAVMQHGDSGAFHPHVTIAHRDLKPSVMTAAWPEYENRTFRVSFKSESIFLLKLEDGRWKIFSEFPFGD